MVITPCRSCNSGNQLSWSQKGLLEGAEAEKIHNPYMSDSPIYISAVVIFLLPCFYSLASVNMPHCFFILIFWQIQAKEKESQQSKILNEEFGQKIQEIARDLNSILFKLEEKTDNITQAKADQKVTKNAVQNRMFLI